MPTKVAKIPILYKVTKRGSIAWYKITVVHKKGYAEIHTEKASVIGGKSQIDIAKIESGVNIGKANETTPYEQANLMANSWHKKLLDEGYQDTMPEEGQTTNTDQQGAIKPMLAQSFNKKKHTNFPYFVQPKLDGMRCLAKLEGGKVILTSRKGKPLTIPHVQKALKAILSEGLVLDGELYVHGILSFQEVVSACKKVSDLTNKLEYHVYDIVDPTKTFAERASMLQKLGVEGTPLFLVHTKLANDFSSLSKLEEKYVGLKYEGVMVRELKDKYKPGFRSDGLLKLKQFEDAEFKIVDVVEASGRDAGTAIFVCCIKNGSEFNCRPQGTFELRQEYWNKRKKLIGKKLTVKYQGLTDDGIPRFPSGVTIRDYE